VPTDAHGHKPEPELDRLSNILKQFNDQFSTLFADADRVAKRIRDDIAPKVAADAAYQNAKENTPHTARMAHIPVVVLGRRGLYLERDKTMSEIVPDAFPVRCDNWGCPRETRRGSV
jgi:hypothetical protein